MKLLIHCSAQEVLDNLIKQYDFQIPKEFQDIKFDLTIGEYCRQLDSKTLQGGSSKRQLAFIILIIQFILSFSYLSATPSPINTQYIIRQPYSTITATPSPIKTLATIEPEVINIPQITINKPLSDIIVYEEKIYEEKIYEEKIGKDIISLHKPDIGLFSVTNAVVKYMGLDMRLFWAEITRAMKVSSLPSTVYFLDYDGYKNEIQQIESEYEVTVYQKPINIKSVTFNDGYVINLIMGDKPLYTLVSEGYSYNQLISSEIFTNVMRKIVNQWSKQKIQQIQNKLSSIPLLPNIPLSSNISLSNSTGLVIYENKIENNVMEISFDDLLKFKLAFGTNEEIEFIAKNIPIEIANEIYKEFVNEVPKLENIKNVYETIVNLGGNIDADMYVASIIQLIKDTLSYYAKVGGIILLGTGGLYLYVHLPTLPKAVKILTEDVVEKMLDKKLNDFYIRINEINETSVEFEKMREIQRKLILIRRRIDTLEKI